VLATLYCIYKQLYKIRIITRTEGYFSDLCIDGHIRLAGGRDTNEGRVEVCSNGVWGAVWNGGWDSLDATVACRQLGLYQPHSSMLNNN
jgi:hypothetical protein